LDDVRKSYGYDKDTAVYTRIRRLTDSGIVERILKGEDKGKYMKVAKMLV
jgi:predicted transcriptional regulator